MFVILTVHERFVDLGFRHLAQHARRERPSGQGERERKPVRFGDQRHVLEKNPARAARPLAGGEVGPGEAEVRQGLVLLKSRLEGAHEHLFPV